MGTSGTAITPVATYTAGVYPPAAATPVLAADVEAGEQAFCNRWAWLLAQPRVVEVFGTSYNDASSAHAQVGADISSTAFIDADAALSATSSKPVKVGDFITIHAQVWASRAAPDNDGAIRFRGQTLTVGPTQTFCDSSIPEIPAAAGTYMLTVSGIYVVAQNDATITFQLQARAGASGTIKLLKAWSLAVTVYRVGL